MGPDFKSQLLDTQLSLAHHVNKVHALEGVISEHDTIKRQIRLLRQLVEKSTHQQRDWDQEQEGFSGAAADGGGGAAGDGADDDDARSIRTIVPHELERVEEEDEEQIARQEMEQREVADEDDEERARRVELGRPM
jgi:hypothetical protein